MLRSFYVALTGLTASKDWLDITSNNVANANTIGFKSSRPVFQDIVLQDFLNYNAYSNFISHTTFGGGVKVGATLKNFTQGPFQVTGVNTDIAIEGEGFLIVKNRSTGATYYTRDGQLQLASGVDENGQEVMYLIHNSGLNLVGRNLENNRIESIKVPTTLAPHPTNNIYIQEGSNLDPRPATPTKDFNPDDSTSYNHFYTLTIYDTQGHGHDVGIFFKKLSPRVSDSSSNLYYTYIVTDDNGNKWFAFKSGGNYYKVTSSGTTTVPATAEKVLVYENVKINGLTNPVDIYWVKDGTTIKTVAYDGTNYYDLTANTTGTQLAAYTDLEAADVANHWELFTLIRTEYGWKNLISSNGNEVYTNDSNYPYVILTFNSNAVLTGDTNIELQAPTEMANILRLQNLQLTGLTQYPTDFSLGFKQDGYDAGRLQNISISENGVVTGIYSNGISKNLYQIQLAYFKDKQSLIQKGSNLYTVPSDMAPLVENAGISSIVRSGTLELSNVDIAQEMINMIAAEKAYQANAKIVQSGQTILDTTLNLKR
jgi:flagellar hook protein FlgE